MERLHPNLRSTLVESSGFYLDGAAEMFEATEYPFRNASNRMWWEACLRSATEAGIGVVLTGVGGNLSLGWDGMDLIPALLRRGSLRKAWSAAAAEVRYNRRSRPERVLARSLLRMAPLPVRQARWRRQQGFSGTSRQSVFTSYSPMTEEFARATSLYERTREKGFNFEFQSKLPPPERTTAPNV
jgi:hypothetical protein